MKKEKKYWKKQIVNEVAIITACVLTSIINKLIWHMCQTQCELNVCVFLITAYRAGEKAKELKITTAKVCIEAMP